VHAARIFAARCESFPTTTAVGAGERRRYFRASSKSRRCRRRRKLAHKVQRRRAEEDAMAERTEREVLNHLIERCRDGERGFRVAAEHVTETAFKRLFAELAVERARCADELVPHAQRLGGAAAADGTSVGALHRKWIGIKDALTRHDEHAIVVEVVRGDRATLQAYKDAVDGILPPMSRDVVERQYERLRMQHEGVAAVETGTAVR
jgi:uncharacterized protein (TIGR02284 family)